MRVRLFNKSNELPLIEKYYSQTIESHEWLVKRTSTFPRIKWMKQTPKPIVDREILNKIARRTILPQRIFIMSAS